MFWEVVQQLNDGFTVTLSIFFLTIIFSFPLGLLISFGSMSKHKFIKVPIRVIIWIVRGVPLMLQILIIVMVPGILFKITFNKFVGVIIAFSINYACYLSEIFRSGIESIPKGQYEAAQVLGLTKRQTFFKVILKQSFKRVVAPIGNEVITLVKDTALANVVLIVELIVAAKIVVQSKAIIWPIFFTGVYYLIFVGVLTLFFNWIEKKLSYFKA